MNDKLKRLLKVITFYALFIVMLVGLSFFKTSFPDKYERLVFGIAGVIAGLIATIVFLKIDKKSFKEIGIFLDAKTIPRFIYGVGAGILIMGTILSFVILYSNFTIALNSNSGLMQLFLGILPLWVLAYMEELSIRGYALVSLQKAFGIRWSIYITAFLFGCSHILYGWSIQSAFLGAAVWGILYGLAAVYSGGIAMATGLHFAANVTTSAFGIDNTSFNVWILKGAHGESLQNFEQTWVTTVLPNIFILILGVGLMEWYIKMSAGHRNDI